MSATKWRIKGENLSSCNCDWGCPCQFNARPTHGNCEAVLGVRINEGKFGDVNLAGVVFSAAAKFPGAIHEGNGTLQLFIEEKATPAQRAAILEITSANSGGGFFAVLATVCPNVLEPKYASISLETDRGKRTGRLQVHGAAQSTVEPIRNPITGEEHRASIHLPNGFEFKVAEVANAVNFSVTSPEVLRMDYSNRHAHLSEIDWSN